MTKELTYGKTRKYGTVLFLSFITFGIYYLVYQYRLFQDLQDHFERAFSTEPRSYPTKNNPITMLIFWIFFPIYPFYLKYELLHEHIETSNISGQLNCPIGITAILGALVGLCTFGIVPLINERKWQHAFNNHILAHEKV